nr:uncharacterized protein LOC115260667 [Aedes albopictus]
MSNKLKPSGDYQPVPRGSGSNGRADPFNEVDQHLLAEGDKIPFVDSEDEDEDDDRDDHSNRGSSGGNASDDEDDIMTESQENLAMAYVNRYKMPSLSERRNQEKLTVTIEHEKKSSPSGHDLKEEAKDVPTELKAVQDRAIGLRRNSISMPTLTVDDLDALRQARIDEEESKILVVENRSLSTETTASPETPSSLRASNRCFTSTAVAKMNNQRVQVLSYFYRMQVHNAHPPARAVKDKLTITGGAAAGNRLLLFAKS